MSPTLPLSLSPHVCLLCTPDVHELFEASGLPPLPQTLQSFVPLTQVTTRTTTLTSVPLSSFPLRFSDLTEIENAAREDEEQRAERTMDWIGARITRRALGWVKMVEAQTGQGGKGKEGIWKDKTPWWEEIRRCVEGDCTPNSDEGWNHPTAVIFAVSTRAANPLQALQDLNARPYEFPPWVDPTHLRYYLIIHPSDSPLADPIAEALFNAVKKQYGLHSYLLPLALPTNPLPPPVPVPTLPPRLPPIPMYETPPLAYQPAPAALSAPNTPRPIMSPMPRSPEPSILTLDQQSSSTTQAPAGYTLRLSEGDIQNTAKFVREFVVMSLVPWMEKCVLDWNETFSSSRRLPSRLLSSTRRLFGSSANTPVPSPVHSSNASVSSVQSRSTMHSHMSSNSISSIASTSSLAAGQMITQQRRLAEFATILGDYKLATTVWESLRKEGRGGSDILPMLLSPSLALALHAAHALTTLRSNTNRSAGYLQRRALSYAVRWVVGIDRKDFLSPVLEGERWLVQAAGSAEDLPSSLVLAHAAFLSEKKSAKRRSAFWYLSAADRLEKAGFKPIAMYLFHKAHELYTARIEKELSPSFWDSEGVDPSQWRGFEAVLPGIEHELGRLLYTTGDTEGAVRFFLGLLRETSVGGSSHTNDLSDGNVSAEGQISPHKVYLEDFRVAAKHFKITEKDKWEAASLTPPITFCQTKETRIRFTGDFVEEGGAIWEEREEDWLSFWASRGKERLERRSKAAVNEYFWVDIVMRNPLDVDVNLSALSVIVRRGTEDVSPDFVEVEAVDGITLGAHETRTIPIAVRSSQPVELSVTHATYEFLGILPTVESLAIRGSRLHDTPQQRQGKVYAPDTFVKVSIEEAQLRLQASFVDDEHLVLMQGECTRLRLWMSNSGSKPIDEIWMVTGKEDEVWVDIDQSVEEIASSSTEILRSSNSLAPSIPYALPLEKVHGTSELASGDSLQFSVVLHAPYVTNQTLCLLFVFREAEGLPWHCARVTRHYQVQPMLKVGVSARPGGSLDHPFLFDAEIENVAASASPQVSQVTTISPMWSCKPLASLHVGTLTPRQTALLSVTADPWQNVSNSKINKSEDVVQYLSRKVSDILQGSEPDSSDPPPVDLICQHFTERSSAQSLMAPAMHHFFHCSRRTHSVQSCATSHPHIPSHFHRFIFPLYNPYAVDVLIFWELPDQGRSGHILIPGLTIGARHGVLDSIIEKAETAKVKRSMYAETQRERMKILQCLRNSEWNAEMNPVVVTVVTNSPIYHDFSEGPCKVLVAFTLRNYSPTNPSRVTLKLAPSHRHPPSSDTIPPSYAGRLTYNGVLSPLGSTTFNSRVWVSRPGTFSLDGWTVETEVDDLIKSQPASASQGRGWRSRLLRYVQGPPESHADCITVLDAGRS